MFVMDCATQIKSLQAKKIILQIGGNDFNDEACDPVPEQVVSASTPNTSKKKLRYLATG